MVALWRRVWAWVKRMHVKFTATRGMAYSITFLFVLTFGLSAANLLFTAHAISQSQHQWCSTLTLLTAHRVTQPTDPEANPSRENAYIFYTNLLDLRERFGCG